MLDWRTSNFQGSALYTTRSRELSLNTYMTAFRCPYVQLAKTLDVKSDGGIQNVCDNRMRSVTLGLNFFNVPPLHNTITSGDLVFLFKVFQTEIFFLRAEGPETTASADPFMTPFYEKSAGSAQTGDPLRPRTPDTGQTFDCDEYKQSPTL